MHVERRLVAAAMFLSVLLALAGPVAARAQEPAAPAPAVTFDDVLKLLQSGTAEEELLKRLAQSPTVFTLDAAQVEKLKKAGATPKLLAALQGKRPPAGRSDDINDFAIILDCSGSMSRKTRDGQSKMEAAKRVVADMISKMPNGRRVAFIIYGHDLQLKCKAVKVVRPMSELTDALKAELTKEIAGLQPTGDTPIALALKTAGAELARSDGRCGVILITDGMETCQGNPAEEAARLAANPKFVFGLNVIGFDVDPVERQAVEQIAKAGNGKYHDARSAAELSKAVEEVAEKIPSFSVETPDIARKKSALSAVVVNPLTLKGFPGVTQAYLVKPGTDPRAPFFTDKVIQSTKKLGTPMVVAPGAFDVVLEPVGGTRLTMYKNLEVKNQETVTLNPNRLVGAVQMDDPQIDGLKNPREICLVTAGFDPNGLFFTNAVYQSCTSYGKAMLASPNLDYDVVVIPASGQRITVAQKVNLKAGQLTVVGGTTQKE